MHAPLESHAETFVPLPAPNIRDDESTHSNNDSDLSSEPDEEHENEYTGPHIISPEGTRSLSEIYGQTTP